jgi:hypothetical protein
VRNLYTTGLLALALAVTSGTALAQKKGKPACGISYLPFTEGASWVYMQVAPDQPVPARGVQADAPSVILIKVTSIKREGKTTVIELEEGFRKVKTNTTIKCTKNSLTVDPASFFWAGEPGGGRQMTLKNIKRTGASYPGARGFKVGTSVREEFKATVERGAAPGTRAKIPAGKVEMERDLNVAARANVSTASGDMKGYQVEISLSGRGSIDGDKSAEREMAAGAKAVMWFAPRVGLVKVINRFNQAWVLRNQ